MILHACHHWFWITFSAYEVIGFVLASPVGAIALTPPPDVTSPSASTERKANSTIQPNAIHESDTRFSSDMDDTYNGENSDVILPFPFKKYHSKYTDLPNGKKYKPKPKLSETNDKIVSVIAEEYEVTIKKLISTSPSSSVTTPSPSVIDLNATESVGNVTDETLNDEPSEKNETLDNESSTTGYADLTTLEPLEFDSKIAVAAATSVDHEVLAPTGLDAGSITGITLAIVVVSGLFGAISFVLYRRRYLNKPQVLNDKSSTLDSSGYIDDTSLRENSEEMYSLDNDSFLNSLEAMTIQNYWTENVKHTKL